MAMGHNGGPPLVTRNFKKRWADALFSRRDKPMGAVAMGFLLYMRMDGAGRGIVISDAEFQLYCGVSDGSCRSFKKWLLRENFIEIVRRGYRGSCSEFLAQIPGHEIPAPSDAIQNEIAAPNTDIQGADKRHPIPVLEPEIAAPVAANAGNPSEAGLSCARELVINYNNKNNYLTSTTTVEQDAAREAEHDPFTALNGSTMDLVTFIAKAANVDGQVARTMLRSNVKAFGAEALLEAHSATLAEMAEGVVAAPYKYFLACAKGAKAKPARFSRQATTGGTDESRQERIARKLRSKADNSKETSQ